MNALRESYSSTRPTDGRTGAEWRGLSDASAKIKARPPAAYRYYAGYSAEFVRRVLIETQPVGARILDPWNGSGATTTVASEFNYCSEGVDVNPVMVIAAKARLGSTEDWESVTQSIPAKWEPCNERVEVLARWFTDSTAAMLRGLERAMLASTGAADRFWPFDAPEQCSVRQAIAELIVSALVRELMNGFRTSNPTWIRLRVQNAERCRVTSAQARRIIGAIVARGPLFASTNLKCQPVLRLGNCETIDFAPAAYDLVLTSPPYCTRLDYVVSTLPELATMGIKGWHEVALLRSSMLGGPSRNTDVSLSEIRSLGTGAQEFLVAVKAHRSKAAGAYYYRFYSEYIVRYVQSLHNVVRAVKPGGHVVLVVQDSYFKDIMAPLSAWSKEALVNLGMTIHPGWSYPVPNPKALNPAGRQYRSSNATTETVVVARKGE